MKLAKSFDFMYLGVHGGMETNETFQKVKNAIVRLKPNKIWVHVSIPCSSGSPLRRFGTGEATSSDIEWFEVAPKVLKYPLLGDLSSFELPWQNIIWEHELTKETLTKAGHSEFAKVRLCQTGVENGNGQKVGKALCFTTNSKEFARNLRLCFGECVCVCAQNSMRRS